MLGGLGLRNLNGRSCVVHGPASLVLLDPSGFSLPLERVGTTVGLAEPDIRLRRGETAVAQLQLWNACAATSAAHLWIVLAHHEGKVDLGSGAAGRCEDPAAPPSYALGGFFPGQSPRLSAEQKQQERNLRLAAIKAPKRVRAGSILHYLVILRNRANTPITTRHCPVYHERLWLWSEKLNIALTHQYVLNCRPLGTGFAAHAVVAFAMDFPVPQFARGDASIEWGLEDAVEIAPTKASIDDLLNSAFGSNTYSWKQTDLKITGP
jgi:hypothetical protein